MCFHSSLFAFCLFVVPARAFAFLVAALCLGPIIGSGHFVIVKKDKDRKRKLIFSFLRSGLLLFAGSFSQTQIFSRLFFRFFFLSSFFSLPSFVSLFTSLPLSI